MAFWVLVAAALLLFAASSKSSAGASWVTLDAGNSYRIKMEVLRSEPPITPEVLNGMKQGLELSGATDVQVKPGSPPSVEYTQRTVQTTTLAIGPESETSLQLGPISLVIRFISVRLVARA